MKTKQIFFLALLVGYVLLSSAAFSQETKESKKALDAFINATTKSAVASEPVPGAEITVEIVSKDIKKKTSEADSDNMEIVGIGFEKKIKCISNEKGEFSFSLSIDQLKNLSEEFHLQFTINPKDPTKFLTETNTVVLKVKKTSRPKFDFVVTFIKSSGTTNKGTFAVNRKAQT